MKASRHSRVPATLRFSGRETLTGGGYPIAAADRFLETSAPCRRFFRRTECHLSAIYHSPARKRDLVCAQEYAETAALVFLRQSFHYLSHASCTDATCFHGEPRVPTFARPHSCFRQ